MTTLKDYILLAISDYHSGSRKEGELIAQAASDAVIKRLRKWDVIEAARDVQTIESIINTIKGE